MDKKCDTPSPKYLGQMSGICDLCGVPLKEHPECVACGILVGPGHISGYLEKFRGGKICTDCRRYWERLEKLTSRTWQLREIGHRVPKCLGISVKGNDEKD